MKKISLIIILVLTITIILGFIIFNNQKPKIDNEKLIGSWKLINLSSFDHATNKSESLMEVNGQPINLFMTFKIEGTTGGACRSYSKVNIDECSTTDHYSLENGMLYYEQNDNMGFTGIWNYKFKFINNNKLELAQETTDYTNTFIAKTDTLLFEKIG